MKIEAVSVLRRAHSDLAAQGFALADLARDERRGVGLVHPQKELGARHRGEHCGLLVPIDPAQLRDALVAEHSSKPALASAGYQRLQLLLTAKHGQLIHDDPNSAAVAGGVEQAANNEIEPEIRERERRRAGLVAHRHEQPAFGMLGPFESAPRRSSVRRRQIEEWPGSVCNGGDNPGALLVRSWVD